MGAIGLFFISIAHIYLIFVLTSVNVFQESEVEGFLQIIDLSLSVDFQILDIFTCLSYDYIDETKSSLIILTTWSQMVNWLNTSMFYISPLFNLLHWFLSICMSVCAFGLRHVNIFHKCLFDRSTTVIHS